MVEPANATVYFVSISGSDLLDGRSPSTAWRTLNRAAASAKAGVTVEVADGNYPERVSISTSGAPGLPITFQSQDRAVVEGFEIRASYVHILGFEITNRNQTEETGQGIRIVGSHDVVIHNSIHNLCFEGIFLEGGPQRDSLVTSHNIIADNTVRAAEMVGIHVEGRENLIEGNDISDTRQYPSGCPRRKHADADGIRFFGSEHVFQRNYIHDISLPKTEFNRDPHTDCFQTWGPAENVRLDSNWCEMPAPFVGQRGASNHFASVENFAGTVRQLNFSRNVVLNVGQGLIVQGDGTSPIAGVLFEKNTMDNVLQEAIILKNAVDVHVRDCIFDDVGSGRDNYLAADATSAYFASNNDMYLSNGAPPGTGGSRAPHRTLNPLFRDPARHDFRLQPISPIVGAGAELSR